MPWTTLPVAAGSRVQISIQPFNELASAVHERLQFVHAVDSGVVSEFGKKVSVAALNGSRGHFPLAFFLNAARYPNGNIAGWVTSNSLFISSHSPNLAGDLPYLDTSELLNHTLGQADWSDANAVGDIPTKRMLNETRLSVLGMDWTCWSFGSPTSGGHRDDAALWSELVYVSGTYYNRWHIGPATSFTPAGVQLKLFTDSGGVFSLHSSYTIGAEQTVDIVHGTPTGFTVQGNWEYF